METVNALEKQLEGVNKGLPKLPKGLTQWLADYAWLLVLIGVVLSVLSLLALIPAALIAFGFSTAVGLGYGISGYGFNPLVSSLGWLNVLLSLANLVIVVILEALAVGPLRTKKHRGWQLIFTASLVSVAFSVVTSLVMMQLNSLIFSLIWMAIGLYILFQVRPHFLPHAATKQAKTTNKPEFKAAADTTK